MRLLYTEDDASLPPRSLTTVAAIAPRISVAPMIAAIAAPSTPQRGTSSASAASCPMPPRTRAVRILPAWPCAFSTGSNATPARPTAVAIVSKRKVVPAKE